MTPGSKHSKLRVNRCRRDTCEKKHTDHYCAYCSVRLSESDKNLIDIIGCTFHSAPPVPDEQPKFNSADLLLLANDEWKRREERKHNHENIPWCSGFINGFLTDKKWARECVDKLLNPQER